MKRTILIIGFICLLLLLPSGSAKSVAKVPQIEYYDLTGKKVTDTLNMPNGVYIKKYLTTRKVIVNRK